MIIEVNPNGSTQIDGEPEELVKFMMELNKQGEEYQKETYAFNLCELFNQMKNYRNKDKESEK